MSVRASSRGSNPSPLRRSRIGERDAVDPLHGHALRGWCGSSRSPARGHPGHPLEFSTNSEAAAASSRKSISIRTERASVSTTSTSRRRRNSGARRSANARGEEHVGEVAREPPLDARAAAPSPRPARGPRRSSTSRPVDLGDRGRRDRLAEAFEQRFDLRPERGLDDRDRRARGSSARPGPAAARARWRPCRPTMSGRVDRNCPSLT